MDLKDCHLLVTPTSYGINDPSLKSNLESLVKQVTYNPTGKPLGSAELALLLVFNMIALQNLFSLADYLKGRARL